MKLTNVRAAGKDETIRLTLPRRMTLEQAIAWIDEDELAEVTPSYIHLRKRHLDANERNRCEKSMEGGGRGFVWLQQR